MLFLPSALHYLPSPDLWWLLAQGQYIWTHTSLPTTDVFSFTAAGQTWHNDQWLSSLIFYGLFKVGGLNLLHVFKWCMLTATWLLLMSTGLSLRKTSEALSGEAFQCLLWGLLVLAFSHQESFFDVRAYLFSYFFVALWWRWALLGRPVAIWKWLLSAALWANLHAGVSVGVFLMGLCWLTQRFFKLASPTLKPSAQMGCECWPLLALASLLNSSGIYIYIHLIRLMGSHWGRYLNEWQPLWRDWETYGLFPLFGAAVIALCAFRKLRDWRLAVLATMLLVSFTGWRHIVLFCWIALPLVVAIAPTVASIKGRQISPIWIKPIALLVAAFLLFIRVDSHLFDSHIGARLSLQEQVFPRFAADFLQANRQLKFGTRIYAMYGYGGYLLWRLYPDYQVFMDGRAAQVYSIETYEDYLRAAFDKNKMDEILDRYQVDLAVLQNARPDPDHPKRQVEASRSWLDGNPKWKLVYEDDLCCIYARASVLTEATNLVLVRPENPHNLVQSAIQMFSQPENHAKVLASLNKALELQPDYPQGLFALGVIQLRDGNPDGLSTLQRLLSLNRADASKDYPGAHYNLGIYWRRRDPAKARAEFQAELLCNPGNTAAQQALNELK